MEIELARVGGSAIVQSMDVGTVQQLPGDLFGALAGKQFPPFDLITCDPPYMSTRHMQNMPQEIGGAEAAAALDGCPFGVSVTLRLIREALHLLAPGGA